MRNANYSDENQKYLKRGDKWPAVGMGAIEINLTGRRAFTIVEVQGDESVTALQQFPIQFP